MIPELKSLSDAQRFAYFLKHNFEEAEQKIICGYEDVPETVKTRIKLWVQTRESMTRISNQLKNVRFGSDKHTSLSERFQAEEERAKKQYAGIQKEMKQLRVYL